MPFSTPFQQLMSNETARVVAAAAVTLLLVVGLILAILCVIKHQRRQKDKKAACKNTIELNEEEFQENIECAKREGASFLERHKKEQRTDGKYMEFNDEEFVEGVPRR